MMQRNRSASSVHLLVDVGVGDGVGVDSAAGTRRRRRRRREAETERGEERDQQEEQVSRAHEEEEEAGTRRAGSGQTGEVAHVASVAPSRASTSMSVWRQKSACTISRRSEYSAGSVSSSLLYSRHPSRLGTDDGGA